MIERPRVLGPDFRGCEDHGNEHMTSPLVRKGSCLACRRNRESKRHYNGPRCINGHLKTPQTWIYVGARHYRTCRPCNLKASRDRYARLREARVTRAALVLRATSYNTLHMASGSVTLSVVATAAASLPHVRHLESAPIVAAQHWHRA